MYYEHFGLHRAPFRNTPDTRLFYPGGERGAVLEALLYAIAAGEGIVKVVGEVGSGKTMLCRMLDVSLPDSVDVVYLANPGLSPDDILHAIALEMGLPGVTDANRLQVMQSIHQELLARHADGRQVVLFVEEAQGMPWQTLEEIRLLSNLETQDSKLLQMVLFGQPELDEKLLAPEIRQLRERITQGFELRPFRSQDVADYIAFRLHAAGYRGPAVFRAPAVRRIARASRGLVRRINILADKALLAAYAAGGRTVTARHVRAALSDSEFNRGGSRWPWLIAIASGAAAASVAGWLVAAGSSGTGLFKSGAAPVDEIRIGAPSARLPLRLKPATELGAPGAGGVTAMRARQARGYSVGGEP
jgi:MSHA biogenesis protein MshM